MKRVMDRKVDELARVIKTALEDQKAHYGYVEINDLTDATLDGWFDLEQVARAVIKYFQDEK